MTPTEAPATPLREGYEYPSLESLKKVHLNLLERESSGTDEVQLDEKSLRDIRRFMVRARATGRILDEERERGVAQTLLNYWATVLFRNSVTDEAATSTALAEFDDKLTRELDESQCPYCGLEAYGKDTRHLFFGREEVVKKWLKILSEKLVLVILGASGAGKTSLIRAGLLPALAEGKIPGSQDWKIDEIILDQMDQAAAEALRPTGNEPQLRVVHRVDEGLLSRDRRSQLQLLEAFGRWLTKPGAQRKAVLVGRIESLALIRQWLEAGHVSEVSEQDVIPPFNARELRQVIEAPAATIGLRFEEGLVDSLVNDFLGDPAALALLQFILLKLWDARVGNRITWDAYHALGGGQGAVETTADAVYKQFDENDRELTQQIFLRLARPTLSGALSVNRIEEAKLAAPDMAGARVSKIVEKFAAARILRRLPTEQGQVVEVAQEALLRKWPRFLLWLEGARRDLLQRERVADAAEQWRERGRPRYLLWRALSLEQAWAIRDQLSPLELQFIRAQPAS